MAAAGGWSAAASAATDRPIDTVPSLAANLCPTAETRLVMTSVAGRKEAAGQGRPGRRTSEATGLLKMSAR